MIDIVNKLIFALGGQVCCDLFPQTDEADAFTASKKFIMVISLVS